MQLHRRQCPGQGRIGVAVHQHPVRLFRRQHLFEPNEHLAGLPAVAPRSDAQVHIRFRDLELFKKGLRQVPVVVLAGMDEELPVAGRAKGPAYGGRFDELGAGADDGGESHFNVAKTGCYDFL
jgi:hypothetical protein